MPRWCGWPRDPDTCVAATHGSPAAPPAQRQRHRSGSPVAKCAGARPVAPEHDRGPAGLSQGLARASDDHRFAALAGDRVIGTCTLDIRDAMGQPAARGETLAWCRGADRLPPRPRVYRAGIWHRDGARHARIAFDDVGLHRVTGSCFADNTGSWRVMEKAGMRREQHGVEDS